MSSGSEPNDLDRDVDASMRMFQKAKVGAAATISPIRPSRVLLVLDGSSQDDNGMATAAYLRGRFNTETLVLDARDGLSSEQEDLAIAAAETFSGARPIKRKAGDSYDVILSALKDHSVDLVIVPCPYGRSFDTVGVDSAGTVIDVMLSRCPIPILVIRRDDQILQQCVENVAVIIGSECELELQAAAWAFGLAESAATIALNLVIEKEHVENIRSILEALQPDAKLETDQFRDALTKTHHALHSSMAKTASSLGCTYQLTPLAGEIAPPNPLDESTSMLLVMPLEVDDRFGQGFVQDRIRRSPHPILVVPGHVKKEN